LAKTLRTCFWRTGGARGADGHRGAGQTQAFEFADGKLIYLKLEHFKNLTWDSIKERVGLERLIRIMGESDLIGLEDWSAIPHMSGVWRGLLDEALPAAGQISKGKTVFFDLADPEKRTCGEVLEALG
jgi:hypothetical protein